MEQVLLNAVYASWLVADSLGHQWAKLGWPAVAEAIKRVKGLRAAAKKIAALTRKYTTPGVFGYGIEAPTPRGGKFTHVTWSGRSEFEIIPGSPEEPECHVHQWVMRPGRILAAHAAWVVSAQETPECLTCEVMLPARRRHLDALLFRVDTVNVDGVDMSYEEVFALLKKREKWDIATAARALDKALVDAGVRISYGQFSDDWTIELNLERILAETESDTE